jgi:hypothetical protein
MRFSRFQVKFGHVVSHCQCSKIEILDFFKNKLPCVEGAPKHEHTIWIFNLRIFYMPFSMSKNGLCMWISAYHFVQNDVFFKVPYVLWIWDFVDMYLTHLGTRIWSPIIHTYSKKWFFWPPELHYAPWVILRNFFFFNFEPYDLAYNMSWMCTIWWTHKCTIWWTHKYTI